MINSFVIWCVEIFSAMMMLWMLMVIRNDYWPYSQMECRPYFPAVFSVHIDGVYSFHIRNFQLVNVSCSCLETGMWFTYGNMTFKIESVNSWQPWPVILNKRLISFDGEKEKKKVSTPDILCIIYIPENVVMNKVFSA